MSHDHTAPIGSLPVLDLDGACEFLELTRSEIMVLVPQAMIEIREKFELMRQDIKSDALGDVHRHAHTIKSVAASIGAQSVRQTAETIERHATAAAPTDCPRLAETLDREIANLSRVIADLPE
jgi:HPt (histidine-containing phosphotransfer) domain-containing protein